MNNDLHLLCQLATELLVNAEDCGDYLQTAGTLVPDDVEMLKRVEAFCQEPRIWVVEQAKVIDCDYSDYNPEIFLSRDDARAFYDKCVHDAVQEFSSRNWLTDTFTSMDDVEHFEMWDAFESYAISHYSISLRSVTLK